MGNMYCEMCKRNQPPGFFCPACGKKLVRVQDTGSDLSKIDAGHVIEISDDDTMYKCFERDALFSDIEHGSPPFHNSQPYFPKLFDKYVLGVSPKDFPSNVNPDNYVHTSCAKCGEVTFVHSSFRDFSIPEKDGAICLECRKKYKYKIPVVFVAKKDSRFRVRTGITITNMCVYRAWEERLIDMFKLYNAQVGDKIRFCFNLKVHDEIVVEVVKT